MCLSFSHLSHRRKGVMWLLIQSNNKKKYVIWKFIWGHDSPWLPLSNALVKYHNYLFQEQCYLLNLLEVKLSICCTMGKNGLPSKAFCNNRPLKIVSDYKVLGSTSISAKQFASFFFLLHFSGNSWHTQGRWPNWAWHATHGERPSLVKWVSNWEILAQS